MEERRAEEAEEARRKQAEFERSKEDALKSMKGIMQNELGLKDIDDGGLGLKGMDEPKAKVGSPKKGAQLNAGDCRWGDMSSSVVDLRCLGLDPDKPIRIDPAVVRGRRRFIPAQIDPATFENAHYNKGYWYLMHFTVQDAANAIKEFEQALKERPNDPLVYNGWDLAVAIHKGREQKIENNKARAAELTREAYAQLTTDDIGDANASLAHATDLDPDNLSINFLSSFVASIGPRSLMVRTPEGKAAYQLVGHSLVSIAKENYGAAEKMMEVSKKMAPNDPFITNWFKVVSKYETERASEGKAK